MNASNERRHANDQKVAEDIATHGCHIISVFDPENKHPGFTYSVGIRQTTGAPEAIVIGLPPTLGHALITRYNNRLRQGERFQSDTPYKGFLEGFAIYIEPARQEMLNEYTLGCERYYQNKEYTVVQLIYPTTKGIWPWQDEAPEVFRASQPMLGRPAL